MFMQKYRDQRGSGFRPQVSEPRVETGLHGSAGARIRPFGSLLPKHRRRSSRRTYDLPLTADTLEVHE